MKTAFFVDPTGIALSLFVLNMAHFDSNRLTCR